MLIFVEASDVCDIDKQLNENANVKEKEEKLINQNITSEHNVIKMKVVTDEEIEEVTIKKRKLKTAKGCKIDQEYNRYDNFDVT